MWVSWKGEKGPKVRELSGIFSSNPSGQEEAHLFPANHLQKRLSNEFPETWCKGSKPTALLIQLRKGAGRAMDRARLKNTAWAGFIFQHCKKLPLLATCFFGVALVYSRMYWFNGIFLGQKGACARKGNTLESNSSLPRDSERPRAYSHRSHCTRQIHHQLFFCASSWVRAKSLNTRGLLSCMKQYERLIAIETTLHKTAVASSDPLNSEGIKLTE